MAGINAGVTLMQDFCRAESDTFSEYIDYIDREEAQRNAALPKFNLFNDYVGNPYKGSHLFTADKDYLSFSEKQDLKSAFQTAQINGSVMWQTVISFDNAWLEKNGVYNADKKMLDERKIYEVTRHAIGKLLERENLNNAVWSAGIHYNTDNLHVHIAIVEPYPMRELMMYNGNLEVRGKMKMSNIKACKSVVVNELMQSKEINQKINFIIRKDIVEKLKERELSNDPELQDKFLALCQSISMLRGALNYNNRETAPIRKQVDEISRIFLNRYCPEKYKEFVEIIERQSHLYAEAYGGGNENVYKEDKHYELMQRLGNAVLKSAKEHVKNIEEEAGNLHVSENVFSVERFNMDQVPKMEMAQEEKFVGEETSVDTDADLIEYEELFAGEESPFKMHAQHKNAELTGDFKEAEEYFKNLNSVKDTISGSATQETVDSYGDYDQYAEWFQTFKNVRNDINQKLRNKEEIPEEKILEFIRESERNPFLKAYLGEIYLYGKLSEIDLEKSDLYFEEALEIFERDVDDIIGKENKFDFKSYIQYRIGKQYARGWGAEYDPEVAAEWFEKSGTSYASFSLGNLYYTGEGVGQNFETAFKYYQGAEANPFACLKIAQMYEKGIGVEKDTSESKAYYDIAYKQFYAAEANAPDAIFEYQLGNMLYYGKGCEKDTDRAIEYLEDAVKQKNVPATLLLSRIYMELNMTERMPDMIAMLEELAGKGENEAAQYTLGNIYTNDWEFYDLKKGVEQYEKAAEQGNEYAQYRLGKLYIDPEMEIYDLWKGIEYLERATEQGNEYAQYQLGKLYINPETDAYDLWKGIEYLERAAEQGNEYAQYQLGKLYINPETDAYDLWKGIEYLERAAEQGNEYAQYQLGKLYINPESEVSDPKKGITYLKSAVEQGNENAKYLLGKEFLEKNSFFYNPEKGLEYMKELAEQGNEFAQLKLGVEYIKGENVDRDLFQAREWLGKSSEQGNEIAKNILDHLASSVKKQTSWKMKPMNEFDKALAELRKSLYKAQEETMKNLMIYEQELQEELEIPQGFYI